MPVNNKCAGCTNKLDSSRVLQCSQCNDKYHHECLNITEKKYKNFDEAYKANWVCPSCRSKVPKSDNSNTPVRSTALTSSSQLHENITMRTKPKSSSGSCNCISAESIREIIREELRSALESQILEIKHQLTTFEHSINFLSNEYDSIKKTIESQTSELQSLQKQNELLRKSNRDISQRFGQVDQLSRSSNIEIHCVPEHRSENLFNLLQQLAKTIQCPLKDNDIHYCSRIAKMNTSSPRPRSILVKFSSPRLRDSFLAASITFNKKNPKEKLNVSHLGIASEKKSAIYIVENLNPENKALHASARAKSKELNYRYVWVRNGKIFMRKTDDSKFIWIKDTDTLNNLD